jgi:uncharacterized membrane protein HdeD (DUF308 family)
VIATKGLGHGGEAMMRNEAAAPDGLAANWWAIALRGVAAIGFGVLALLLPGLTVIALVYLFGAYAIVDGAFSVIAGWRRTEARSRDWWRILAGVAGIIAGVLAFVLPGLTALALLTLIGAWAVVIGALEIVAAWRLRDKIEHEWVLAIDGVLAILFGALVLIFPGAGALAVVWIIGAFAIASGVILLIAAYRLRRRTPSMTMGQAAT